MSEPCGDGMCWSEPLCEVIDDLRTENTQLREVLTEVREIILHEQHACELLAEVYTPEGVDVWMRSGNRSLNGERPLDLIRRGDGDRVLARIQQLIDGNF